MNTKSLSDIVILVGGQKFEAHELILSARSPVFLAMFQSDLKMQTNTLKIEEIGPDVFAEVLRFIYTDKVENLDGYAEELLVAADRYMLDLLKAKCEESLARKIAVGNCAELLALADLHSAKSLKAMILDCFQLHAAKVAETVN